MKHVASFIVGWRPVNAFLYNQDLTVRAELVSNQMTVRFGH